MQPDPAPDMIAQARRVVTDPAVCAGQPMLRMLAWQVLTTARGQRMNVLRLIRQQHRAAPEGGAA
ncbi:hypothetical protein DDZ14_08395 [Maritimibacter sp. 55A14]|uniref:hypothetical protein n=1 Tax=Maritimibacter sp. 55A14 TaxID=2174844 RepID=UPI000D607903|nr:hypothetical protein [Maritimibacter sp. 55A14]PWE32756.1 hypothetical protein DDZ14_08395 [Maritimibacter sp. 55A14]